MLHLSAEPFTYGSLFTTSFIFSIINNSGIMQYKPYIVELSFTETQESNDSINEGPSITMVGPSQTNAVLVPLHDVTCRNHRTEFKSDIKLYAPYPCHLSHSLALLHIQCTLKSISAHLTTLFATDAVTCTYCTCHYTYTVK